MSTGTEQTTEQLLAEAITCEQAIADAAAEIRDEEVELTPALFMKLWPLLKRPIPSAFIETIGIVQGKPYPSTGVRSVQVQIDRMNNVLTPMWWWDSVVYEQGGKLAKVEVSVGNPGGRLGGGAMLSRASYGGVKQGSSEGNIYKGSYTNAAKLAFARLGVGHEVYLGVADFDPDTDADAAGEQARTASKAESNPAGEKLAGEVVNQAWEIGMQKYLRLAASRDHHEDVGDCSTKAKAKKALAKLNVAQLEALNERLIRKAKAPEPSKIDAEPEPTEEAPDA